MSFDFFVCADDQLSKKENKFVCEFYLIKKRTPDGRLSIEFSKMIRMFEDPVCPDSIQLTKNYLVISCYDEIDHF